MGNIRNMGKYRYPLKEESFLRRVKKIIYDEDPRIICGVFCGICMIRTICQFRDFFKIAAV